MKYLDVDPTVDQGPDGEFDGSNDAAVWEWLVTDPPAGMTISERIESANRLGRDDIVEELTA
jgi:hypothetical protein